MTGLVRTLAFVRKEAAEVGRQPQLLLLLVIGPFLVLLVFGAGLREDDPPVRTLFVSPPDSELTANVVEFASAQSDRLIVEGVVADEEEAVDRLEAGHVEMVVAFPADVRETVRQDEQAVITLYHTEMDPIESRAILLFANTTVDQANRLVLSDAVAEAQGEAEGLHEQVADARERTGRLRAVAEDRDVADQGPTAGGAGAADDVELDALRGELGAVALAAGPALALLDVAETEDGRDAQVRERLDRVRELTATLEARDDADVQAADVAELDDALADLDDSLTEFRSLSPDVVVAPFRAETVRVAGQAVDLSDFYAPAVAVVLLQHLLVTALGLSLVRETELGTTELYRVAPLRPGEIVIGKFFAHMLIAGLVAAALTTALILGLGVPLAGDPLWVVATLAAVLFASAALGFTVSLAARSDSQAVQYAMLILLVTVFFSGFMLAIDRFIPQVAWVGWLVPATYAIEALREVMLRGVSPDGRLIAALVAYGAVLGCVSWLWLRRRLRVG